jgi:hypothetical protein
MRECEDAGWGLGVQGARLRGELSRVEERSSISASHLSLAEELFLGELGSVEVVRTSLPNTQKVSQLGWVGNF